MNVNLPYSPLGPDAEFIGAGDTVVIFRGIYRDTVGILTDVDGDEATVSVPADARENVGLWPELPAGDTLYVHVEFADVAHPDSPLAEVWATYGEDIAETTAAGDHGSDYCGYCHTYGHRADDCPNAPVEPLYGPWSHPHTLQVSGEEGARQLVDDLYAHDRAQRLAALDASPWFGEGPAPAAPTLAEVWRRAEEMNR